MANRNSIIFILMDALELQPLDIRDLAATEPDALDEVVEYAALAEHVQRSQRGADGGGALPASLRC